MHFLSEGAYLIYSTHKTPYIGNARGECILFVLDSIEHWQIECGLKFTQQRDVTILAIKVRIINVDSLVWAAMEKKKKRFVPIWPTTKGQRGSEEAGFRSLENL